MQLIADADPGRDENSIPGIWDRDSRLGLPSSLLGVVLDCGPLLFISGLELLLSSDDIVSKRNKLTSPSHRPTGRRRAIKGYLRDFDVLFLAHDPDDLLLGQLPISVEVY